MNIFPVNKYIRSGNETRPINQTAMYISTWTYEGCLPVFDITFEPHDSIDFRFYYDITIGINDPDVFIPPRQCLTDNEYTARYDLFGGPVNERMNRSNE
jgi:hypothetical protein